MKNCAKCVYFLPPSAEHGCGRCDYPIPEWLKIGASGGGYISTPEYEGQDCATFRSRADIMAETTKAS